MLMCSILILSAVNGMVASDDLMLVDLQYYNVRSRVDFCPCEKPMFLFELKARLSMNPNSISCLLLQQSRNSS